MIVVTLSGISISNFNHESVIRFILARKHATMQQDQNLSCLLVLVAGLIAITYYDIVLLY